LIFELTQSSTESRLSNAQRFRRLPQTSLPRR
jgi:hypothetical protein